MTSAQNLTINLGERSYDIHIGQGLIEQIEEYVPGDLQGRRIFVVCDENVVSPYAGAVVERFQALGHEVHCKTLPAGESTKSWDYLKELVHWMLEHKAERSSIVFAVGGGVIGDLAGFAASMTMRGLPYVQVPTSLLAMVDSSVGGKTAINTDFGKNLAGAFYQPVAVVMDMNVLKTLPARELRAGYAEIVKYGLINDPDFFAWLEQNSAALFDMDHEALRTAISKSCAAKAAIVAEDEKEKGARALLNLGHTFGHALEAAAGYDGTLLHGEAVAMGMVMAFDLSVRMDLCPQEDLDRVSALLQRAGLLTSPNFEYDVDQVMESLSRDKKADRGSVAFILARGIGKSFIHKDVPMDMVKILFQEKNCIK